MIKNCCIVDTVYGLALYLLYLPLSEVEQTVFYFGSKVPSFADKHFKHIVRIDTSRYDEKLSLISLIKLWLFFAYHHFVNVRHKKIYGQDHNCIFGLLTWSRPYTLLEDAPGVFGRLPSVPYYMALVGERSFFKVLLHVLRFGIIPSRTFGQGPNCRNIIITEKSDLESPLLNNKHSTLVNFNAMWSASSDEKKQFVLGVFGITAAVIKQFSECDTLFLTQPFREDCGVADAEWIAIVGGIVKKYPGKFMIKVHPRDGFQYEQEFPQVKVFKAPVPQQLISIFGTNVKRVITINSSAIYSFPDDVEKIILGSQINEKIASYCG